MLAMFEIVERPQSVVNKGESDHPPEILEIMNFLDIFEIVKSSEILEIQHQRKGGNSNNNNNNNNNNSKRHLV